MRFRSNVVLFLALVVMTSAIYLWTRPRPDASEKHVALPPETAPSQPPSPSSIPAPRLPEVQALLDRLFDRTVTLDPETQPSFVAADFNGDDVADLAAAVRPRDQRALAKINGEIAAWSRQDATAPSLETVSKPEPVKVAAGDRLLAVVHGVDPEGWRHPDAGHGYLVRNALGARLRLGPLSGVPDDIRMRANRPHAGDVILTTRGPQPGLVFWTGANYAWADLATGGAAASPTAN